MDKPKPKEGAILLFPGCKNNCIFCATDKNYKNSIEIRKQEIRVVKNLEDLKKKGVTSIEICGNDPIEYPKIIRLVRYIKENDFDFVQLSSHGRNLCDKEFANKLVMAGVDRFVIPMYGSNARIHDSVTRAEGSFDETLQGVKNLTSFGVRVYVSCLVLKQNKDNLIDIARLLKSLGLEGFHFAVPYITTEDYSYYVPLKDIGKYVREVYDNLLKNDVDVFFIDFPYCVFGKMDSKIMNNYKPKDLGKYCQPGKKFKTKIKDTPSYRIKKKVDMCKKCKAYDFCDGFYVNDIDRFGTGNLKPIL